MDKEDAFWIGNCIGVVALLATIVILAPIKEKERQAYAAKQKAAAQAAQATKEKEIQTAKDAVLKQPTSIKTSTGSPSAQSKTNTVDANSTGASQAAGAAAASRQKLHS
ncbi:MAG TPA: hypothetical protein V6C69_16105 [Trichormus sp.]